MKYPRLFDLYTDFLTTNPGVVSAQLVCDTIQNSYYHDSVSRMLSQPELDQKQYWHTVKPCVRQIESPEGSISVDDSINEKPYSEQNELISWHYDHTSGSTVQGINFVTFTYNQKHEGQIIKLPIAFELVRKDLVVEKREKKGTKIVARQVRQASVSKIELVKNRLHVLVHQNKVLFKYVSFDTWYSCKELIMYIVNDLEKHVVCAIKDNRTICLEAPVQGQKTQWVSVSQTNFETDKVYHIYLKGIDIPLVLVKKVYQHLNGSVGVQYLVSSDTTLSAEDIDAQYHKRWSSEDLHRSLKQNTALEKMPAKTPASQANHMFASMVAYTKLEVLKIATHLNHYTLKRNILTQALKKAYQELQKLKELCVEKNLNFPNFSTA